MYVATFKWRTHESIANGRLAVASNVIKTKKSYHCAVQKSDVHQSYSSLPAKSLILVFLI
jgi:hypothetical protein